MIHIKTLLDNFSRTEFIFITSEAKVYQLGQNGNDTNIQGFKINVQKTDMKNVSDAGIVDLVGTIKGHEAICQRCYENVEGNGEIRILRK